MTLEDIRKICDEPGPRRAPAFVALKRTDLLKLLAVAEAAKEFAHPIKAFQIKFSDTGKDREANKLVQAFADLEAP